MNPLTAICIILASASLWLQRRDPPGAQAARLGQVCAALLVGLTALRLFSLVPGIDLPVDRVMFRDQLLASPILCQMGANVALALACVGVTLLTLDSKASAGRRVAEFCCFATLALSLMAGLGGAHCAGPVRGDMGTQTA